MVRAIVLVLAACLTAAAPAAAQIEHCTRYAELIEAVVAGEDPKAAENLLNVSLAPRCFAVFVAGLDRADRSAFFDFVRRFERRRADEQAGSSHAATASTSIVAQGPVARVLSAAVEYGALTQSVNGQVITVRGNLAGVPSLLVNRNVFPYCVGEESTGGYCVEGSLLSVLQRFSFAVAFDASRDTALVAEGGDADGGGEPAPVTFTAARSEISSISARVELWNRRDVTSPAFAAAWRDKVGAAMDAASADLLQAADFAQQVIDLPGHDEWFRTSVAAVRAAGRDRARVVEALTRSLDSLAAQARAIPGFDERVADALAAYSRFFLAQNDLVESLAARSVLAFEYTNIRPALEPARSNYRLIFDYPLSARTKIVANGAVTFYHAVPADQTIVTRYRDAQVGVQLDHGIRNVAILGPAVLSFAGYFQYQHSPALLNVGPTDAGSGISFVGLPDGAAQAFAAAGNIGLVQAKLVLVPAESGIKIPLSVTWSNRTELIDEPAWRGQIGLSYDLDSLLGLVTGR